MIARLRAGLISVVYRLLCLPQQRNSLCRSISAVIAFSLELFGEDPCVVSLARSTRAEKCDTSVCQEWTDEEDKSPEEPQFQT
ncbi:uncharacterized protein UHOD_12208 [Ustilago sp. UG-2017b]|nr:uncharacterized protein UHOD_12208 [Ustilago sp. UG-2017b]